MRTKFSLLLLSTTIGFIMAGLAVPAQAAQVVYWTGIVAKSSAPVNRACPVDTKKMIIVTLRVRKGEKIVDPGVFTLNLKNGRDKQSEGSRITRRKAEYIVILPRRARIDVLNPRDSYAFPVELSEGAHPRLVLYRTCVGTTP